MLYPTTFILSLHMAKPVQSTYSLNFTDALTPESPYFHTWTFSHISIAHPTHHSVCQYICSDLLI